MKGLIAFCGGSISRRPQDVAVLEILDVALWLGHLSPLLRLKLLLNSVLSLEPIRMLNMLF